MTQSYQGIGKPSPELEYVSGQKQGWPGAPVEQPVDEISDPRDYSFFDDRANTQLLGLQLPNMAGYQQTPTAALQVQPVGEAFTFEDPAIT